MRLLLDTHIWVWSLAEPEKLTRRVRRELANKENEAWLSPISIWEVLMLAEVGKLAAPVGTEGWVKRALQSVPLKEAPLTYEVALETRKLSLHNSDPADRFLVATAKVYGLALVTADRRLIEAEEIQILANQ